MDDERRKRRLKMEKYRLSRQILNLSVSRTKNKFSFLNMFFNTQRAAEISLNTQSSDSSRCCCLQETTKVLFMQRSCQAETS